MSRILVAFAAGASALQERPPPQAWGPESPVGEHHHHHHQQHHHHHSQAETPAQPVVATAEGEHPARVLLFGCSLDRNAVEDFCGSSTKSLIWLHARWCHNETLNTKIGAIQHPGVGYFGDLDRPVHRPTFKAYESFSTNEILRDHARNTIPFMFGGQPDLVVVDSSLWDLAIWKQRVQCGAGRTPKCHPTKCTSNTCRAVRSECQLACGDSMAQCECNRSRTVSKERVQQWCNHDLRGLLSHVKSTFPQSRIAFRTAPTVNDEKVSAFELYTSRDVEMLYECVTSSMQNGKLFGEYEVVDYHELVKQLAGLPPGQTPPGLYRYDGYHPNRYASLLYVNKVLNLVGVRPPDPEAPQTLGGPLGPTGPSGAQRANIDGAKLIDGDDDDFAATAAEDDVDGDDS